MYEYTIKLNKNDELSLVNDTSGESCKVSSLLDIFSGRTVYAFYGQMGAGKTTLIKQLCSEMGTDDVVNSPTFAIVNVYETKQSEIYHFDCYRIKNIGEAIDLGAEEYIYSGNYCFIEWPEMIEQLLPDDTVRIEIKVEQNGTRKLLVL